MVDIRRTIVPEMALQTLFADSFAHYDDAGIPMKWSTAGGAIETNPARVRTGLQSLRIQLGDAPTKVIANGGNGYTVTGFAWMTDVLGGETICQLVDSGSGDIQLYLVQNANGSISLWTGAGVLLGTSPAATLTLNTWWYIEINTQLDVLVGPVQAVVTVTNNASQGAVAVQVINATGFATSQTSWDTFVPVGPAGPNHGWIADFYNQGIWDSVGNPLAVMGAPKIYGVNVPNADGLSFVSFNTLGKTIPFDGTAAPWWNQVNELPETTGAPIFETDALGGWVVCGQAFFFDVSGVPVGRPIAAVQLTYLFSASAGSTEGNATSFGYMAHLADQAPGSFLSGSGTAVNISAGGSVPFRYVEIPFDLNPFTNAPFVVGDFSGVSALELGPFLGEPA